MFERRLQTLTSVRPATSVRLLTFVNKEQHVRYCGNMH